MLQTAGNWSIPAGRRHAAIASTAAVDLTGAGGGTDALPPGNGLAQYGLAEPAGGASNGRSPGGFGDRDPAQRSRYVLMDGTIKVIDDVCFQPAEPAGTAFHRGLRMPELPEVETTRRGIAPHLLHQVIRGAVVRQPQLRWPVPDLADLLSGHTVQAIERRGKSTSSCVSRMAH